MKTRISSLIGSLLLCASVFPAIASAQSTEQAVLREGLNGYTGTSDTLILNGNANQRQYNYGGFGSLLVGSDGNGVERRGLLRFDLTGFAGKVVSGDGTLRLTQANTGATTGNYEIVVYQISEANANWIEGTGSGTAATNGQPAWDFKAKGSSSNIGWAGSAGLSTAGVDYLVTPIATLTFDVSNDRKDVFITIPEVLLQFWIDNPSANGGLLFMPAVGTPNSLGGFFSSNYATDSMRPELSFNVNVPEASTYGMIVGSCLAVLLVCRRRR